MSRILVYGHREVFHHDYLLNADFRFKSFDAFVGKGCYLSFCNSSNIFALLSFSAIAGAITLFPKASKAGFSSIESINPTVPNKSGKITNLPNSNGNVDLSG